MYRLRKVGKKERKLFGVLGGISKYIDPTADPAILRILFVVLALLSVWPMAFVGIYIILAVVLKTEDYEITKKYPILDDDEIAERNENIKEMAEEQREEDKKGKID